MLCKAIIVRQRTTKVTTSYNLSHKKAQKEFAIPFVLLLTPRKIENLVSSPQSFACIAAEAEQRTPHQEDR